MQIVALLIGVLICFGIPIGGVLFLRKKQSHSVRIFFIGAAAFFFSQICFRLPINQLVLPQFGWFHILQMNPLLTALYYGGTAGLVEEGARWIAIRYFVKKDRNLNSGLIFGLGHGGCEAILIIGISMLITLVLALTGNTTVLTNTAGEYLIVGFERFFAILYHVGASVIVMYGVKQGKAFRYFLLAFVMHTVLDAGSVILTEMFSVSTIGMEAFVAVTGLITFVIGMMLFQNKRNKK